MHTDTHTHRHRHSHRHRHKTYTSTYTHACTCSWLTKFKCVRPARFDTLQNPCMFAVSARFGTFNSFKRFKSFGDSRDSQHWVLSFQNEKACKHVGNLLHEVLFLYFKANKFGCWGDLNPNWIEILSTVSNWKLFPSSFDGLPSPKCRKSQCCLSLEPLDVF